MIISQLIIDISIDLTAKVWYNYQYGGTFRYEFSN